MPKAWSVQLKARDGPVPGHGTSLGVFYADDSHPAMPQYYPQLQLVIKAPQMLLQSHRKIIFCKHVLYLWINIVSNNLTKISCSDITDLSGGTLGRPYLSVIRVEQGRGAEWREQQLSSVPLATRPVLCRDTALTAPLKTGPGASQQHSAMDGGERLKETTPQIIWGWNWWGGGDISALEGLVVSRSRGQEKGL